MSMLSFAEYSWGGIVGAAMLGQLPTYLINSEYHRAYGLMTLVITGVGLLGARLVDIYIRYKKGLQTTDTGKLGNCEDSLVLQKQKYEGIVSFKDKEYAILNSSHEQLKALVISQQEIIKKFG